MTEQIFPYANIVVGVLVLIVGGLLHWLGQLVAWLNWDLATKIGVAEKKIIPEYRDYERGIAAADSLLGWIYVIAAIGVTMNISWAYKLLWFPGVVMIYHALSFWFWTNNQTKAGRAVNSLTFRIIWVSANALTGGLALLLAWRS